jgi:hypothetical protein
MNWIQFETVVYDTIYFCFLQDGKKIAQRFIPNDITGKDPRYDPCWIRVKYGENGRAVLIMKHANPLDWHPDCPTVSEQEAMCMIREHLHEYKPGDRPALSSMYRCYPG